MVTYEVNGSKRQAVSSPGKKCTRCDPGHDEIMLQYILGYVLNPVLHIMDHTI